MSRLVRAGAVGCLLLTGCGIAVDDGPVAIPSALRYPPAPTSTASAGNTLTATLWYVEGDLLASRPSLVPAPRTVASVLQALLGNTALARPVRTAIPAGTELRSVTVAGRIATVDVSAELAGATGDELRLAVAQLVFTATGVPGVDGVTLQVDGDPAGVPLRDAALSARPLSRLDFSDLATATGSARPTVPAPSATGSG